MIRLLADVATITNGDTCRHDTHLLHACDADSIGVAFCYRRFECRIQVPGHRGVSHRSDRHQRLQRRPASATSPNAGVVAPAAQVSNDAQKVTIAVGKGMSFEPAALTVHAGQPVELTLRNDGQFPHDFTLTEGVGQPVKITANGGQTASGTFTLDKPGSYNFECSMPAHALAGMRGTITAQ